MKIGLVLSSTPAYSETFFISKIKGLQEKGHEVILFVQQQQANFQLCKVKKANIVYRNPVVQVLTSIIAFVKLVPSIKHVKKFIQLEQSEQTSTPQLLKKIYLNAHILKEKVDWLHFGFTTMALDKEFIAKAIGAKMAVSFRGFDIAIYPLKQPNCYDLLWQEVDKVHTISNDLLIKAYALGLHKETPFEKITPAIDTVVFNDTRSTVNIEKNIKFLTVARLHWKKGLLLTLEALAMFKSKGYQFRYVIVGTGSQKEFERISFAILELGLTEEVQLVGKKNKKEILEYYQNSNIYLQYSISEGFCNAVLEAQAMGLLCIVSDAEGLSENVLDAQTGWVVPKNNVTRLVKTLEKVTHLSEFEKTRIISIAQKRVRAQFNLEKQQREFQDFYKVQKL